MPGGESPELQAGACARRVDEERDAVLGYAVYWIFDLQREAVTSNSQFLWRHHPALLEGIGLLESEGGWIEEAFDCATLGRQHDIVKREGQHRRVEGIHGILMRNGFIAAEYECNEYDVPILGTVMPAVKGETWTCKWTDCRCQLEVGGSARLNIGLSSDNPTCIRESVKDGFRIALRDPVCSGWTRHGRPLWVATVKHGGYHSDASPAGVAMTISCQGVMSRRVTSEICL